jgi:hypothetical protein
MDPRQKQRTARVLGVVAVLALIAAFWAMQIIRHRQYVAARSKAEPWKVLEQLSPPPGGRQLDPMPLPPGSAVAVGTSFINADCATVLGHYQAEFARHGFTEKPYENKKEPRAQSLAFCEPQYYAILSCKPDEQSSKQSGYMILLQWTGESC